MQCQVSSVQYRVGKPLASVTAWLLLGIDATSAARC